MSLMSGISIDTFVQFGGQTGTATNDQLHRALQLSWTHIEDDLGAYLYPSTVTKETHPWPANGRLMLNKTYLNSVTTVTAKYDVGNCECDVLEYDGCAFIVDAELSIVSIRNCYQTSKPCGCSGCRGSAYLVEVTYVAGLAQPLADDMKLAIALLAKDYLAVITSGSKDEFQQLQSIASWSSMGYSESRRGKLQRNRFSMPSRAEMVEEVVRKYKKRRVVNLAANPRSPRII